MEDYCIRPPSGYGSATFVPAPPSRPPPPPRHAFMPLVTPKPGHVRPVWSGHPWVFAQAIAYIEGGAVAGDEVTVVDPAGNVLGRGLYTPRSAIPVRMFTRE